MQRTLSALEAKITSFHDCHVHGLSWSPDRFSFSMNIQYILNWIAPADASSLYSFSVCEARLTFSSVSELQLSMDWGSSMLDAEIDVVRILKSRTTPNGNVQNLYEIEFSTPEARMALWSTGYEVVLLEDPKLSLLTSIPISDEH